MSVQDRAYVPANGLANESLLGSFQYGIVIDLGSSGSRLVVYQWPKDSPAADDHHALKSPPSITTKKEWTRKTLPGILSFSKSGVRNLWTNHFSNLIEFAENIVPQDQHSQTPVFVLATAGMRLLPEDEQKHILREICRVIRQNSQFHLPDCKECVQVIDGATEGLYGWLSANYLLGKFDNYDSSSSDHESIGFMDMGGALTQIAFVPSLAEDREAHHDDLSRIILRNRNGDTQDWRVFVETWLGFGANEARRRFLNSLVDVMTVGSPKVVSDPCMPHGATMTHQYRGTTFEVRGTGKYETCLKSIYPLLLKNLPCDSYPCLFNGVHGPKLDFEKDKFVGISEYWYTANDVFQSGGEYDYHGFNARVKEYCESEWTDIVLNSEQGKYSGLDPDKFLKTACFKASWVLNILHEGFELPRLAVDVPETTAADPQVENLHVPFKSANSIKGEELSWTLGKILLYASSKIEANDPAASAVGIYPKEISGKEFISGNGEITGTIHHYSLDEEGGVDRGHLWYFVILLLFAALMTYRFCGSFIASWWALGSKMHMPVRAKSIASNVASKIPGLQRLAGGNDDDSFYATSVNLEEGIWSPSSPRPYTNPVGQIRESFLRTRSSVNLTEQEFELDDAVSVKPYLGPSPTTPLTQYQPLKLGPQRQYSNPFQKSFPSNKKLPDMHPSPKSQ